MDSTTHEAKRTLAINWVKGLDSAWDDCEVGPWLVVVAMDVKHSMEVMCELLELVSSRRGRFDRSKAIRTAHSSINDMMEVRDQDSDGSLSSRASISLLAIAISDPLLCRPETYANALCGYVISLLDIDLDASSKIIADLIRKIIGISELEEAINGTRSKTSAS